VRGKKGFPWYSPQSPDLCSLLRPLADRAGPANPLYPLLGGTAPSLIKGASESLAGRAALVDVSGFRIEETGAAQRKPLWGRGAFPRSFLAAGEPASLRWRQDFIRTILERDLPQPGITIPSETMLRFWTHAGPLSRPDLERFRTGPRPQLHRQIPASLAGSS
jgi:hypothetical protein